MPTTPKGMSPHRYAVTQNKQLERFLKKGVDATLKRLAIDGVRRLQVLIKQYWYDKYTPEDYDRTWSFLESVSAKVEDGVLTFYFDEEILQYRSPKVTQGWGEHVGFDEKRVEIGEMISYLDQGVNEGSPFNPRQGYGANFVDKFNKWLEKYIKDDLKKQLGIDIGVKLE